MLNIRPIYNNPQEQSVISTQPTEQAIKLEKALEGTGIAFFKLPMIETETLPLDKKILVQIQKLNQFDRLIFTSRNGVEAFWKLINEAGIVPPKNIKTAVIGRGTAEALRKHHITSGHINPGQSSTDFVEYLKSGVISKGEKILLVQGTLAPDYLHKELASLADVQRINVYRTLAIDTCNKNLLENILNDHYGLIVFSSPSGFFNFYKFYHNGTPHSQLRILSIGKTTTKAISDQCDAEIITAFESSTEGLKNEIINYFPLKN